MSRPSRFSGPIAILLGLCAAGVVGVGAAAAIDRTDLAFGNGVPITRVAVVLRPRVPVCQREIRVRQGFHTVELVPRQLAKQLRRRRPSPALDVAVLESDTGRRLAGGRAARGYPNRAPLAVRVGRVAADEQVDVCLTILQAPRLGIEGGKSEAAIDSPLFEGDVRDETDALSLRFLREPRSVIGQVPQVMRRAALFRPGWIGTWTFWVLTGVVALVVPALLASALAGAARDRPGGES